ncbi:MAG: complex I NDUFA9 subunit family protein [Acetobacterales bacterium]
MARRLVTVFGGSGFIGRYVVQRLARTGATVRVATRSPQRAHFLRPMGNVGQIVPTATRIEDADSVARAVQGADSVVNLVGILHESGRRTFEAVHVRGPESVAAAATSAGVQRLVHVSALGADANSPSAYARSKALGEDALLQNFPNATVLRPSVVFGPEDSFLNLFAGMARYLPALPVFGCPAPRLNPGGRPFIDFYGHGGTRFQPVYVGDVADAAMAGLTQREAPGKVFELGGPRTYSFKELMEFVLAQTQRRRLLVPVPFWLAHVQAAFLELLPSPLLTRDQVRQLRFDNVVTGQRPQLPELGIAPTPLEAVAPEYLATYRKGGKRTLSHV